MATVLSREKFQNWIAVRLAISEEIKKKQEEGFEMLGEDKQYAHNVSLIIQKYKRRENEIEEMYKKKALKYKEEYEEKMQQLEKSVKQKHMINIQSAIEKESHCKS